MKKQVVWQPNVATDTPLNPFVPSERRQKIESVDLNHAHRAEIEVGASPATVEDAEACCCSERLEDKSAA